MAGFLEDAKMQWGDLLRSFIERVIKPSSRPTAGLYLLLAVAVFGGTGLWLTFLMATLDHATHRDLSFGIVTYAVAIIATSIGDVMLDRDASPALRFLLFAMATGAFILCMALTYVWVFATNDGELVSARVLLLCVAPVWITWWLVNGVDQRFSIAPAPRAALGGDAGQTLS